MVSTPKQRENLPCRTCCRPVYRRCISFPGARVEGIIPCRKDTVHSHTCGTITRNYYKQPNFGNYLINLQPGETFDGQPNEEQKSRIRMLTEVECERLQGFPDDFTRYGIINGEVREISRANRYAMLGNAVSVPVVRARSGTHQK